MQVNILRYSKRQCLRQPTITDHFLAERPHLAGFSAQKWELSRQADWRCWTEIVRWPVYLNLVQFASRNLARWLVAAFPLVISFRTDRRSLLIFFVTTFDKISILLRYSLYIHQHCLHRQHNAAVVYDDKTPPIHIIDEWGRVDTHSLLAMVSPQVPSIDDTTKTAIQHVGMREKSRASDSERGNAVHSWRGCNNQLWCVPLMSSSDVDVTLCHNKHIESIQDGKIHQSADEIEK